LKSKLIVALLVVAIAVLPVVAACGGGGGGGGGATKTLTIGGIAFLTGPASQGGLACKQGWELVVDKYNKAGGLKVGNDTYKINLIVEDDAMSTDQAVSGATKLLKADGAKFIVGPLIDALKTAVYPLASKEGALMAIVDGLNVSGALPYDSNADVSPSKPLLIRCHWANDEVTPYLLDYTKANYPNVKNVAVFGVVEKALEVYTAGVQPMLKARGMQQVGNLEQVAPDLMDFSTVMTRLLAAKPDGILSPISTPVSFGFGVKAARTQGFKGPMFCATHQDIDLQSKLGGGAGDIFGMGLTLADLSGSTQAIKDVNAAYLAKYNPKDLISDVFLVGYNGLDVLLQTIQKAGSIDPATVQKTFEGLKNKGDLKTLWGDAYVGGQKSVGVNRVLCYPYYIDAVKDGKSTNAKTIMIDVP
jgi:branched-chain amino acid transport system substrate-binding protein